MESTSTLLQELYSPIEDLANRFRQAARLYPELRYLSLSGVTFTQDHDFAETVAIEVAQTDLHCQESLICEDSVEYYYGRNCKGEAIAHFRALAAEAVHLINMNFGGMIQRDANPQEAKRGVVWVNCGCFEFPYTWKLLQVKLNHLAWLEWVVWISEDFQQYVTATRKGPFTVTESNGELVTHSPRGGGQYSASPTKRASCFRARSETGSSTQHRTVIPRSAECLTRIFLRARRKLTIPLRYWVIFPSIHRAEWQARFGRDGFCPPEFIFAGELGRSHLLQQFRATDRQHDQHSPMPTQTC